MKSTFPSLVFTPSRLGSLSSEPSLYAGVSVTVLRLLYRIYFCSVLSLFQASIIPLLTLGWGDLDFPKLACSISIGIDYWMGNV